MVFRKGGKIPKHLSFVYGDRQLDILNKFSYLGIVFTTRGSVQGLWSQPLWGYFIRN